MADLLTFRDDLERRATNARERRWALEAALEAAHRQRLRDRAPRTAALKDALLGLLVDNELVLGTPWRREQVENLLIQLTDGVELTPEAERYALDAIKEVCTP